MVRAEIDKKLAEPGPGQNFVFSFGPARARTEILISLLDQADTAIMRAGLGPEKFGQCRPLS